MAMTNDHKAYTAADIEAYWQGRLDARAMHALEKAALEDPFLADAMEGYRLQWESEKQPATAHLGELKARLEKRIAAPARKYMAWWKPAIAASLLLTAGTLAWLRWQAAQKPDLSSAEIALAPVTKDTAAIINVPGLADSLPLAAPSIALGEKKPAAAAQGRLHEPEPAGAGFAPPAAPSGAAAAPPAAPKTSDVSAMAEDMNSAVAKEREEQRIDADKAAVYRNSSRAPGRAATNTVRGVVRDENAAPVPGVEMQLRNQASGLKVSAITNDKGEYQINYPVQPDTTELAATAPGYAPLAKKLSGPDSNAIINFNLMPGTNATDEVVVVGYGREKKKATAAPVNGWSSFHQYLSDSAHVPASLRTLHGAVELEFNINSKGEMSDFCIERSLHPTLDAEAIRLIKDGPAWENRKRKRIRIRTSVQF